MIETKRRSFAKTIAWRIIGTLITWAVVYYYSHSIGGSLRTTLVAAALSMVAYYFHERYWDAVVWGRTIKNNKAQPPRLD